MLEYPITVRLSIVEMTNSEGKFVPFVRFSRALAPHPHDSPARSSEIVPIPVRHGVQINFAEKGLGQPRQVGKRLRIDFARHHPAGLHRGGILSQCILNFYAFRQQVRFQLPLDYALPMSSRRGYRDADQDDGEHEEEIRDAPVIPQRIHVVPKAAPAPLRTAIRYVPHVSPDLRV